MTADARDPFEALAAELGATDLTDPGHTDHLTDNAVAGDQPAVPDEAALDDERAAPPTADLDPAAVPDEVRSALEAILLVSEEPASPSLLAQLLEIPAALVEQLCEHLAADFDAQGRGFTIARVAGGYRFQTAAAQAPYVERFLLEGQSSRLSAAALETLAIVAYKQPISRAQIASIRGVNVDGVVRTLHQRGYIAEVGRDHGPGQALLYGTTRAFLERLGLDHLGELPSLGDFVPEADVVETLELALRAEGAEGAEIPDTADGAEGGGGTSDAVEA